MRVVFYSNVSENNAVTKSINPLGARDGTLREETSIIDPVIMVSNIAEFVGGMNYAQIPDFERWYFITNIESVHNNLWRVYMHVDVLFTYRYNIRNNHAIIERNENQYDLLLNDGLFKTQQKPRIATIPFRAGFDSWDFVLAIAGN